MGEARNRTRLSTSACAPLAAAAANGRGNSWTRGEGSRGPGSGAGGGSCGEEREEWRKGRILRGGMRIPSLSSPLGVVSRLRLPLRKIQGVGCKTDSAGGDKSTHTWNGRAAGTRKMGGSMRTGGISSASTKHFGVGSHRAESATIDEPGRYQPHLCGSEGGIDNFVSALGQKIAGRAAL
jgi:hypothetical protein